LFTLLDRSEIESSIISISHIPHLDKKTARWQTTLDVLITDRFKLSFCAPRERVDDDLRDYMIEVMLLHER